MGWIELIQPFALPVLVAVVGYVSFEVRRWREARHARLLMLIALRAELQLASMYMSNQFASEATPIIETKLRGYLDEAQDGEHSMPSGVVVRANPVYDNIVSDLPQLPEEIITPVIAYYERADWIAETLAAFYEGRFETLSKERKRAALDGFFLNGKEAAIAASVAFKMVDQYLEENNLFMKTEKADRLAQETRQKIDSALAVNDDDDRGTI